jgi:hypothetical protein
VPGHDQTFGMEVRRDEGQSARNGFSNVGADNASDESDGLTERHRLQRQRGMSGQLRGAESLSRITFGQMIKTSGGDKNG